MQNCKRRLNVLLNVLTGLYRSGIIVSLAIVQLCTLPNICGESFGVYWKHLN